MFKLKIEIVEENKDSFDYQLDRIKQQLREGYTSGIDPCWDIEEVE